MSSEANHNSSQTVSDELNASPRSEVLSSKFSRKTKFLQSIATSPTELSHGTGVPSIYCPDIEQELSLEPGQRLGEPQTADAKEEDTVPSLLLDLPRVSSPITSRTPSSTASAVGTYDAQTSPLDAPALETSKDTPAPEANEQSPLPLSQDELDEAKSLILDLLGWGVAPEYLVETGLTPAVVFRVFTDLNLRLPDNLELADDLKSLAYPGIPSAEVAEALN